MSKGTPHVQLGQDPVELSDALQAEANSLVWSKGLDEALSQFGSVFYTGSFRLNLMMWPDIDIEMSVEPDPDSVACFFDLGKAIASLEGVSNLQFSNQLHFPKHSEVAPEGLYWKVTIQREKGRMPWKIDLYSLRPEIIDQSKVEMNRLDQKLDREKRALILKTKYALLTPTGRTPISSGHNIYRAVLDEGLEEFNDIVEYLRENGVEV